MVDSHGVFLWTRIYLDFFSWISWVGGVLHPSRVRELFCFLLLDLVGWRCVTSVTSPGTRLPFLWNESGHIRQSRSHLQTLAIYVSLCYFSLRSQILNSFRYWLLQLVVPATYSDSAIEFDPFDPTHFYFLVYGSRLHTGPRLIVLVGGSQTDPSGSVPLLQLHSFVVVTHRFEIKLSELSVSVFPACYFKVSLDDF